MLKIHCRRLPPLVPPLEEPLVQKKLPWVRREPWISILWFVLIAVLFIGYFVLEGFDLGVGILLPFLGKR
jgi:hypothetical protein